MDAKVDPTETYLSMYKSMSAKEFADAREHAINLKQWLNNGGFYPPSYTKVEVDGYIANVMRRT